MKPYPQYKPSHIEWIGEIPEHWKVKKLKYLVAKVGSGITPTGGASVYQTFGIPLLRSQNIYSDKLELEDIAYISEEIDDLMSNSRVEDGDVLLNITGASIGRCYYIPNGFGRANVNQHVCIIRPLKNLIDTKFLHAILISNFGQIQIDISQNGANREGLNFQQIKSFDIFLPDINEQKIVVEYLNTKTTQIDTLIRKKQRLIELLREERAALINEAVTKGIDPTAKMKNSGVEWIGEAPEGWAVKKLKRVAKINPSKGSSPFTRDHDLEVVFLPMENVQEDGSYISETKKSIKDVWDGFTYFEKGDIIVAKITPCFENGKGAYLTNLETEIGFGSTEFHVLRPNELIDPRFLFLITRSNKFMDIGTGSMTGAAGQKRVPTDFIENFTIAVPPKSEQKQIADFIHSHTSQTDATILRIEKEIDLLREYRAALISEAVTGKICVIN